MNVKGGGGGCEMVGEMLGRKEGVCRRQVGRG